jgi:hypothetical protein
VAAALGAANALAAGRPISEAMIQAARSAIPGGRLAQAAFDVGMNLAQGKNLSQAALAAARNQLPAASRAAFDTAVALGQGKNLQQAAYASAGRVLQCCLRAKPPGGRTNVSRSRCVSATAKGNGRDGIWSTLRGSDHVSRNDTRRHPSRVYTPRMPIAAHTSHAIGEQPWMIDSHSNLSHLPNRRS